MKTDEIFGIEPLFESDDEFEMEDEELEDEEMEVGEEEFTDDYIYFDPVSVTLEDSEIVALVKDGETIDIDEWGAIKDWVNINWGELSGTYHVVQNGATIYSFSAANV